MTTPTADAEFHPDRLERLGTLLRGAVDNAAIPGAVVIIMRNGRTAYYEAFGFADRGTGRRMQRDSVFRIASMTKPLTSVAALMLVEQGKLQLIDPVWRYLPELRTVEVAVGRNRESCRCAMTVHDLMRHTSGFTYGRVGDSEVHRAYRDAALTDPRQTNQEMVAKLATLALAHQPGSTFDYGMSTDVLGRVVEVICGMELDRVIAQFITQPLGMLDTAFGIAADQSHRLAEPQPTSNTQSSSNVLPYDPSAPSRWFSGGAGLLSTAADYARFAQLLLNQGEFEGVRLLGRKTVSLMTRNHLHADLQYAAHTPGLGVAAPLPQLGQGYGLGIGVRVQDGLSPVPGSAGDLYWGGALGPYFWVDPKERLSVVFMLQEQSAEARNRYRSMLRALVYQALR